MSKKNNETAIVVTNTGTSINQFFGNIDFEKLNTAVTALANRTNLTEVEKTSALEIIDTWQENVIDKLKLESDRIKDFLKCIGAQSNTSYRSNTLANCIINQEYIDEIEFLVDKTNMNKTYNKLLEAIDEYTIANANIETAQQIVIDVNTTVEDEIIQRKDIELENIRNQAAVTKIGNKIAKLTREILTAINSDKDIVASLRMLKRQETVLTNAATTCVDKAQIAKINVTIDDPKVRESLTDLINFTI